MSATALEPLTIASAIVNAQIIGASRETKLKISEMLSYEVEGADRSAMFKAGHWDGRSSFFDFRTAGFPAGFTHMVARELGRAGHSIRFALKPAPPPLGPEIGTHDPLGYGFTERYDYQPETVRRLERHRRIIARVATGGGKSNIAVLAYDRIRRMTLFLTTRGSLMWQMKENFEQAGIMPGVIGDGILKPKRTVNVGMVQTIASWLSEPALDASPDQRGKQTDRRNRMIALLKQVEFVIGEEAHEAGGNSYYEILRHCPNAHYRLALTATPFMRADAEANMRLQAAFGSIGMDVSEKLLIDRGILATPYFQYIQTPQPALLRRSTSWPTCYDLGIVENTGRNHQAVTAAVRGSKHGLTSLILIQRKKHGEILRQMMAETGVPAAFVFGDHDQTERKRALDALRTGELQTLIASNIFDVGIDVPAVGQMILAGAGKAEVGHRQRIGRVLREKKAGINQSFVLDWDDKINKTLRDHAETRQWIVQSTPGFKENILPPGRDFPFAL